MKGAIVLAAAIVAVALGACRREEAAPLKLGADVRGCRRSLQRIRFQSRAIARELDRNNRCRNECYGGSVFLF